MNKIDQRLEELGILLPPAPESVANYAGYARMGNMVFISGQLPVEAGKLIYEGPVGEGGLSLAEGQAAARLCAINILAQLRKACEGDLSRITQCVRLGGFVASRPDFVQHPQVINGASDVMGDVWGVKGRHARAAVGVSSLPLGAAVEVEALFYLD